VIMVDDVVDTAVVTEIAARVRDSLSRTVRVAHRSISVSCSIGIAISDRLDPAALLQEADTALYRAKEKGRNRWELYDETMSVEARRRLDTEELLRTALDEDGLVLAYQPIVDLTDGRVTSVEALLRLRSSQGRLLAPAEFIEVAEETGLIVPVGAGVLDRACRQAAQWRHGTEGRRLQVSVNISPRQLGSPGLPAQVRSTLAAWDLPGEQLCLELTENALIDAGFVVRSSLAELKDMGVSIAIDDFGTGWSSLAYLRRFPIDVVKIDRSFVSGLGTDPGDTEEVRAVVGLARALGLEVVAEGVETEAQRRALGDLGCGLAQGYLFGRPVAADQLQLRVTAPEESPLTTSVPGSRQAQGRGPVPHEAPRVETSLAEVDGNRTRRTGSARPTRFEGGGAHQVPGHLRRET
jgi:EAL domain-containing protein (putative c-di-GMP-specific phosphodiesterase class I)